jgi:hypothetical protein
VGIRSPRAIRVPVRAYSLQALAVIMVTSWPRRGSASADVTRWSPTLLCKADVPASHSGSQAGRTAISFLMAAVPASNGNAADERRRTRHGDPRKGGSDPPPNSPAAEAQPDQPLETTSTSTSRLTTVESTPGVTAEEGADASVDRRV